MRRREREPARLHLLCFDHDGRVSERILEEHHGENVIVYLRRDLLPERSTILIDNLVPATQQHHIRVLGKERHLRLESIRHRNVVGIDPRHIGRLYLAKRQVQRPCLTDIRWQLGQLDSGVCEASDDLQRMIRRSVIDDLL